MMHNSQTQVGLRVRADSLVADAEETARRCARREPVAGGQALDERHKMALEVGRRVDRGDRAQRLDCLVAHHRLLDGR